MPQTLVAPTETPAPFPARKEWQRNNEVEKKAWTPNQLIKLYDAIHGLGIVLPKDDPHRKVLETLNFLPANSESRTGQATAGENAFINPGVVNNPIKLFGVLIHSIDHVLRNANHPEVKANSPEYFVRESLSYSKCIPELYALLEKGIEKLNVDAKVKADWRADIAINKAEAHLLEAQQKVLKTLGELTPLEHALDGESSKVALRTAIAEVAAFDNHRPIDPRNLEKISASVSQITDSSLSVLAFQFPRRFGSFTKADESWIRSSSYFRAAWAKYVKAVTTATK